MINQVAAAAVLAVLASQAQAHIALWHPSMFGFEAGNWQSNRAAQPLQHARHAPEESSNWFLHGAKDMPPADGVFMELPAGGTFHGQHGTNKAYTEWGPWWDYENNQAKLASNVKPLLHAGYPGAGENNNAPDQPLNVKGAAIAIAYESDVHKVQPEDFVVISVNHQAPFYRLDDYHIPAGLPACPEAGCICTWNWIHAMQTGGEEMYQNAYRCKITGQTGNVALPRGQLARKCPYDKNNCTIGAKTPHVWVQQWGNNNFQDTQDPPYYNDEYGFANGAQTDLWEVDTNYRSPDQAPAPAMTWGKSYPEVPKVTPRTGGNAPPTTTAPTTTAAPPANTPETTTNTPETTTTAPPPANTPDTTKTPDSPPATQPPATTQPPTTQQGEPATNQPGTEEPATNQPGTQEPTATQPGTQEPAQTQPGTKEPAATQPGTQEPAQTQPAQTTPGSKAGATQLPATTQPGTQEPATTKKEETPTNKPTGTGTKPPSTTKKCRRRRRRSQRRRL